MKCDLSDAALCMDTFTRHASHLDPLGKGTLVTSCTNGGRRESGIVGNLEDGRPAAYAVTYHNDLLLECVGQELAFKISY